MSWDDPIKRDICSEVGALMEFGSTWREALATVSAERGIPVDTLRRWWALPEYRPARREVATRRKASLRLEENAHEDFSSLPSKEGKKGKEDTSRADAVGGLVATNVATASSDEKDSGKARNQEIKRAPASPPPPDRHDAEPLKPWQKPVVALPPQKERHLSGLAPLAPSGPPGVPGGLSGLDLIVERTDGPHSRYFYEPDWTTGPRKDRGCDWMK